jgi:hypothetical protein
LEVLIVFFSIVKFQYFKYCDFVSYLDSLDGWDCLDTLESFNRKSKIENRKLFCYFLLEIL